MTLTFKGITAAQLTAKRAQIVSILARTIGVSTSDITIVMGASGSRRLLGVGCAITVSTPDDEAGEEILKAVKTAGFITDVNEELKSEIGTSEGETVELESVSGQSAVAAPQAATQIEEAFATPSSTAGTTIYVVGSVIIGVVLLLTAFCCRCTPRWQKLAEEDPDESVSSSSPRSGRAGMHGHAHHGRSISLMSADSAMHLSPPDDDNRSDTAEAIGMSLAESASASESGRTPGSPLPMPARRVTPGEDRSHDAGDEAMHPLPVRGRRRPVARESSFIELQEAWDGTEVVGQSFVLTKRQRRRLQKNATQFFDELEHGPRESNDEVELSVSRNSESEESVGVVM